MIVEEVKNAAYNHPILFQSIRCQQRHPTHGIPRLPSRFCTISRSRLVAGQNRLSGLDFLAFGAARQAQAINPGYFPEVSKTMTDVSIFDQWADSYNEDVGVEAFPFAGYQRVLNTVAQIVLSKPKASVLDLGAGTGILTKRFYDAGQQVTAVDFSAEMLKTARLNMPKAEIIQADFAAGFPNQLERRRFDFIVMTYAFHHIPYPHQASFLSGLLRFLNPEGRILIGDILFRDQKHLRALQERYQEEWDEEYYLIWEQLRPQIGEARLSLGIIPPYAGVLTIQKDSCSDSVNEI